MKKRYYAPFHIVTFLFVLIVNMNAYSGVEKNEGKKIKRVVETVRNKMAVSFARHLFEMKCIDIEEDQDGTYIIFYNKNRLSEDENKILLNLTKLDKLASELITYPKLDEYGIIITDEDYQEIMFHERSFEKNINILNAFLEGLNKASARSCLCPIRICPYSFDVKKTSLFKTLIKNNTKKEYIQSTGKKEREKHIVLPSIYRDFISAMLTKVKFFDDKINPISDLAEKPVKEIFPDDQRTTGRIQSWENSEKNKITEESGASHSEKVEGSEDGEDGEDGENLEPKKNGKNAEQFELLNQKS